jgi:hypothetical protein
MTEDQAVRIMDSIRHQLAEHFDATQVHVSWVHPDGRTMVLHRGSGNYYARRGMTNDFLTKEQAEVVADEIARNEEI